MGRWVVHIMSTSLADVDVWSVSTRWVIKGDDRRREGDKMVESRERERPTGCDTSCVARAVVTPHSQLKLKHYTVRRYSVALLIVAVRHSQTETTAL
jgi:hypothetical protein